MSMDKVLKCDEKTYVSPPINLKLFLEEASSMEDQLHSFFQGTSLQTDPANMSNANETDETENQNQKGARDRFLDFLDRRGHDVNLGKEAIEVVDDALTASVYKFPIGDFELTYPPADSKLSTHKVINNFRQRLQVKAYKAQYLQRGKYHRFRDSELKRSFVDEGVRSAKDIIMTVHLLTPCNRATERNEIQSGKIKVESRMVVRGDMPLHKLVEKIFCASDFWCNLEDTEDASNPKAYYMHRFPSKFIFIHDTFYTNQSQEGTIDITEPIRRFMERKPEQFNKCQVKDISSVKVIDLNLRLGQPYVYQHQGSCEHLVIFTDLRLLHSSDEQRLTEYPIKVFGMEHQILCCACNVTAPVFIVMESDRMPITPAYMCFNCMRSFHYDRKKRLGNFIAYHYIDRAGIE